MGRPWFNPGYAFGASAALGWVILRVEGNLHILGKPGFRGCALVQVAVGGEKLVITSFDNYPEYVAEFRDKVGISTSYEVVRAPRWAWDVIRHLAANGNLIKAK